MEHHDIISPTTTERDYLALFLQSRKVIEVQPGTLEYYRVKLSKFLAEVNADSATLQNIEEFLLQFHNPGNRHAYYRTIKTFYNWREQTLGLPNSIQYLRAPKLSKLIMPALTKEQVLTLLDAIDNYRDKAIIALFTESGLRLSELVNIKLEDIDWETKTIKIMGKGRKESLAAFGNLTDKYLKAWLVESKHNGNIWGVQTWGIVSMLRRLKTTTGLPCNSHIFRRTFACLLRKAGVDTMTIKDLGRWESMDMVERYTRSINFQDNLKFYKGPLS